jgi:NAD(P)-dependent dehydrogenase (short-subunit alcohol dehydrogenase family)
MTVLDSFRLDGRVAVVTGGAGLYGKGFCRALAEAGARVVLTSRDHAKAAEAARLLRDEGLDVVPDSVDQSDADSVRAFGQRTIGTHGRVDVLVNNAVHRAGGDLSGTTPADWEATSRVNSLGLFLMTQAVAEHMTRRGDGKIINIGSIYGLVAPTFSLYDGLPMTMPAFYSYDKAGMVGFTRYLAAQLGPSGVRVNCIAPGGLFDGGQRGTFVERYEQRTPLRRMAGDTDVLGALLLLASPAGSYITGQTLAVDGGFTAL